MMWGPNRQLAIGNWQLSADRPCTGPAGTAPGTILVLVLVIIALLSVAAVSQMMLVSSESAAASHAIRGQQARAAAMSGIARAYWLLKTDPANLEARYDNPTLFQAQPVVTAGEQWFFTVYADNYDDPKNVRYGLEDEAGKINVNTATQEMLLAVMPGRTDLVACLMDYIDRDSEIRPEGAEQDYYDQLPQPYRIKNGPLATIEELLLVKGFDATIVFGEDANCNGLLDPNENDGDESFPPDDGDGQLNRGLRGLLTTFSYEPNVSSDGAKRVNILTADPAQVQRAAGINNLGNFITQARAQNKLNRALDASQLLGMSLDVDDPKAPGRKTRIASGVTKDNLAAVLDKLTTGGTPMGRQEVLTGRVNINTASMQVLACLPGLGEQAQQVVDLRKDMPPEQLASQAWICSQNVVSEDVFKKLSPYITARSYQFRLRSLGYSPSSGRFCIIEAVIDTAGGDMRLRYVRDLTRLGLPFVPTIVER